MARARVGGPPARLSFIVWVPTATRTSATPRSCSCSRRRCGSCRAAGRAANVISNVLGSSSPAASCSSATASTWSTASTLFLLEDQPRALLYGCGVLIAFALIGTRKLWDLGGGGVLLWLALIGAAAYGLVTVYRASREY